MDNLLRIFNLVFMSSYCLFASSLVFAGWQGPIDILVGDWGKGDNEFYYAHGSAGVMASAVEAVSRQGDVVVNEYLYNRVKIISPDGMVQSVIYPPLTSSSTIRTNFIGDTLIIRGLQSFAYSSSGELLQKVELPDLGSGGFLREIGNELYAVNKNIPISWYKMTSLGDVIESYSEKPLVMGRLVAEGGEIIGYNGIKYLRTKIRYEDMMFVKVESSSDETFCFEDNYYRDLSGNVYCQDNRIVVRYNSCGRVVSEFTLPDDDIQYYFRHETADAELVGFNAIYGAVILDYKGDIYTSLISDDKYSIIKWVWQDDSSDQNRGPFAPTDLAVKYSSDAVVITWRLSPHDEGCVSGYSVERADNGSRQYKVVATVQSGVESYTDTSIKKGGTYRYRISSTSNVVNSLYTQVESITIPD